MHKPDNCGLLREKNVAYFAYEMQNDQFQTKVRLFQNSRLFTEIDVANKLFLLQGNT